MAIDQEALVRYLVGSFHLGVFSGEKQEEILSGLGEALLRRIFLETMERIGSDGVKEYETLIGSGADENAVAAFLGVKIPGYDVFVSGVAEQFKEEMKALETAG